MFFSESSTRMFRETPPLSLAAFSLEITLESNEALVNSSTIASFSVCLVVRYNSMYIRVPVSKKHA